MNNHEQFEGSSHERTPETRLALWLQEILHTPPHSRATSPMTDIPDVQNIHLELLSGGDYHLTFYQQLPDFIMALLTNDPHATTHYAPLLYHLAGCHECHNAYLDLYDSLHAAMYPEGPRPLLGQGTRTLAATPQRMLGHLCQTLISQAEAVLRNAHREDSHDQQTEHARSLLQLALRVSARINQSSIRRYATHDLVRVATLFAGPDIPPEVEPEVYTYTPILAGAGGGRGKRTVRGADVLIRPQSEEPPAIHLQANGNLEGSILQNGHRLELHLRNLDPTMRGRSVLISVPLGSLIEPIRWLGGNPLAIRSAGPVDDTGNLVTPLGETDLSLHDAEEYSLLSVMFTGLTVRAAS